MRRFLRLTRTIKLAERLEDRRIERALASVTYAIWFKDSKRKQSYKRYLSKLGLLDEPDELFMGTVDGSPPKAARKQGSTKSIEDIEAEVKSDDGGWGTNTIADLQKYKAEKAQRGELDDLT